MNIQKYSDRNIHSGYTKLATNVEKLTKVRTSKRQFLEYCVFLVLQEKQNAEQNFRNESQKVKQLQKRIFELEEKHLQVRFKISL